MVVLALTPAARGQEAPPERFVKANDGRLTLRLSHVPLEEAIRTVGDALGAEVRGTVKQSREVSLQVEDVPLEQGLQRLLGDQNFTLTFGENGGLKKITLLGGPLPAALGAVVVPAAGGSAPSVPVISGLEMLQRAVPLPPGGRLGEIIGGDHATLQQLMDIALRNDDPGLRTEAMRAGLRGVENDPDLKQATVQSLAQVDDGTLANLVRSMAHDRAHELVSQVAALTKVNELRTRGYRVLRQLSVSRETTPSEPIPEQ